MTRTFLAVVLMLALSACGTARPTAPPKNLSCNLADFIVQDGLAMQVLATQGAAAVKAQAFRDPVITQTVSELNILEMSAGGEYGAYGAGFLLGWRDAGGAFPIRRDDIHIVTGVSTGSLIATHAFLQKPEYDQAMRYLYVEDMRQKDVYRNHFFPWLLFANSLVNTKPKSAKIAKYLTEDVVEAVGQQYGGPRRLYIGMVNIDSGEFVRVDMVALAHGLAGDKPRRLACYRAVIDASSAVEVAFAPVFIDGHMYADGGARRHLFLIPPNYASPGLQARMQASGTTFRSIALVHGALNVTEIKTRNGVLQIAGHVASIVLDQLLKDSVGLLNTLATAPEALLGQDGVNYPHFQTNYAAAEGAACTCKKEHDVQLACGQPNTSEPKAFCKAFMECVEKIGEADGRAYTTSNRWLKIDELNLGSTSTCQIGGPIHTTQTPSVNDWSPNFK